MSKTAMIRNIYLRITVCLIAALLGTSPIVSVAQIGPAPGLMATLFYYAPPPVTVTFVGNTVVNSSTGGSSSYTCTSCSLSTAAAGRLIVVVATSFHGNMANSITGVTIGGIAATLAASSGTTQVSHSSLWYLVVPTGTTANIVLTSTFTSSSGNEQVVSVYALYNVLNPTPFSTNSATSNNATITFSLSSTALAGAGITSTACWNAGSSLTSGFTVTDYSGNISGSYQMILKHDVTTGASITNSLSGCGNGVAGASASWR